MAGREQYSIQGLAVPETLDLLHDLLGEARVDHPDLSETDASMIEMAIIEIAGNVVRHSAAATSLVYSFTLTVQDDRVVGVLRHGGDRVVGLPDPEMPEDLMAESGRGLALAEAVLSELRYDFVDGENVWTMVRLREPEPV